MKHLYLVLLIFCVLLSSCQDNAVELSREYLVQGNWEQFMVTESYYDQEGKLQDVVHKATSKAVKISKDQLQWGTHKDGYSLQVSGKTAAVNQNCKDLPAHNTVEGVTGKYPDWMSWTSSEGNVTYKIGNTSKVASRVVRTIEFRRVDIVK